MSISSDFLFELFQHCIVLDVRDLISVDDVMEDEVLQMGPNGGLIFCMEFVLHILLT